MNDDRLIVALDVPDAVSALNLTQKLGDAVSFYKNLSQIVWAYLCPETVNLF